MYKAVKLKKEENYPIILYHGSHTVHMLRTVVQHAILSNDCFQPFDSYRQSDAAQNSGDLVPGMEGDSSYQQIKKRRE